MVTVVNDLRPGIVGLKLENNVTKDEFIKTATQAAERAKGVKKSLDLLLLINTIPEQIETGAWMETFFSALKRKYIWHKAAIIGNEQSINWFKTVISYFSTAIYEFFDANKLNAAIDWLDKKEETNFQHH